MWVGVTSEIQKMKDEEIQKDNFLSMASHELKTPVTTIKSLWPNCRNNAAGKWR